MRSACRSGRHDLLLASARKIVIGRKTSPFPTCARVAAAEHDASQHLQIEDAPRAGEPKSVLVGVHAQRSRNMITGWAVGHDVREIDVQHLLGHGSAEAVRGHGGTDDGAEQIPVVGVIVAPREEEPGRLERALGRLRENGSHRARRTVCGCGKPRRVPSSSLQDRASSARHLRTRRHIVGSSGWATTVAHTRSAGRSATSAAVVCCLRHGARAAKQGDLSPLRRSHTEAPRQWVALRGGPPVVRNPAAQAPIAARRHGRVPHRHLPARTTDRTASSGRA